MRISLEDKEEVLRLWIEPKEEARFWLKVVTVIEHWGIKDVLMICCDGLRGFHEAIETMFPMTIVQLCIVHLIRSSMRFVTWVNRKALVGDLRWVCAADNEDTALVSLE